MPDSQAKGPAEEAKAPEAPTQARTQPEVQEDQIDLAEGAGEFVETIEGEVEGEGTGEISEKKEGIGEHRQATGGKFQQFSKQLTDEEAEELKKRLLEKPPTPRQMVQEIRTHIRQEVRHFEKEAKRAQRKGKFKEMADSVRRIRELKRILSDLFTMTAEMVKNLWLKVVHGIV